MKEYIERAVAIKKFETIAAIVKKKTTKERHRFLRIAYPSLWLSPPPTLRRCGMGVGTIVWTGLLHTVLCADVHIDV